MKVLVVGSGGREHAIAWKLSQSPEVKELIAVPGNPGIAEIGRCIAVSPLNVKEVAELAEAEGVDLTVVGPEAPLVSGIVDEFERRGLRVFGPSKSASMLEGSKAFAKEMMKRFGVPTADFEVFDNPAQAKEYVKRRGAPIVVKADGLAGGKGVFVARTVEDAVTAIDRLMVQRVFGSAGSRVVIEDFLEGEEASYLVVSDGESFVPLATSQDHKPVYDGDKGPNTGGMGAYSPAPVVSGRLEEEIRKKVVEPVIEGMKEAGKPFKGVLYAGLMITEEGVRVLEFNVRFGDPEAQAILRRMNSDLFELCMEAVEGGLPKELDWSGKTSICVVLASKGYPGSYEKGKEITGIREAEGIDDVVVFHAGTALSGSKLLTAGGRVLNVTALGSDIVQARQNAYRAIEKIHFEGMHFRRDIGLKALRHI